MSSDLAVIAADPTALDSVDPEVAAVMVTKALEESRSWLAVAMKGTDPTPIAEFKAWAATVEEATKQKKLGREIELDAAEMVRRAERGIGVAIRQGQEAGEIRRRGERIAPANQHGPAVHVDNQNSRPGPYDYATADELQGNGAGIYHMTDDVTDEQFDAAITEAKAEGNLSRANVVRKVKGEAPKPAERHELLRKTRRIDSDRVIDEAVAGAGLPPASLLDLVDYEALDDAHLGDWISSLTNHIAALRNLRTRLTKEQTRRVQA